MSTMAYLDRLDALLLRGAHRLGPELRTRQTAFVASHQLANGGFLGRQGHPDIYYTDFALRTLSLLQPEHPAILACAPFVTAASTSARDAVECFGVLHSARLLARSGVTLELDRQHLTTVLARQALPTGGYGRPGGTDVSAYHTFVAALCYELLAEPLPSDGAARCGLLSLHRDDGGFAEHPGHPSSQTSATAAAVGFLMMTRANVFEPAARIGGAGALSLDSLLVGALGYLATLQAPDGGFLAHRAAPYSDLLSTFSALATLALAGQLTDLNLAGLARFVRSTALPAGGFRASASDTAADVEYTYYGVASLALLGAVLSA